MNMPRFNRGFTKVLKIFSYFKGFYFLKLSVKYPMQANSVFQILNG